MTQETIKEFAERIEKEMKPGETRYIAPSMNLSTFLKAKGLEPEPQLNYWCKPELKFIERPHDQVEAAGYAKFNDGPHLCVDIPDGHYTITVKNSEGRKITFAFVPYEAGKVAQCIDIHDNGGKQIGPDQANIGEGQDAQAQALICFSGGGPDPFRSTYEDKKAVTLTTLLLK